MGSRLLPDKVGQLSQYVIGNPDGPCIGLEAVLCFNHIDELGRHISVGFLQCTAMNGTGTSSHGLGSYRLA